MQSPQSLQPQSADNKIQLTINFYNHQLKKIIFNFSTDLLMWIDSEKIKNWSAAWIVGEGNRLGYLLVPSRKGESKNKTIQGIFLRLANAVTYVSWVRFDDRELLPASARFSQTQKNQKVNWNRHMFRFSSKDVCEMLSNDLITFLSYSGRSVFSRLWKGRSLILSRAAACLCWMRLSVCWSIESRKQIDQKQIEIEVRKQTFAGCFWLREFNFTLANRRCPACDFLIHSLSDDSLPLLLAVAGECSTA